MEMRFWEENSLQHHVKYESNSNDNIPARTPRDSFYCEAANLNFATCEDDCVEYSTYHRKAPPMRVSRQDPLSHRIIEKRRRDRMNNCLADLSRLIPTEYLKKGRGRVEKTEIIEMAIKHMKYLQYMNHYRLGYQECMSEAMRFLVEVEGRFPREPICVRLLGHLQAHCDTVCRAANEAAPSATAGSTQVPPTPDGADDKVIPKMEPNNNYESEHHPEDTNTNGFEMTGDEARDAEEIDVDVDVGTEKREEHHSGYKYKNDIKLRFTQDNAKHPQVVHIDRRNSTPISTDNQTCSSLGSPTPHYIDTAPTLTLLKTAQESESMDTWLTPPTASSTRTPDSALYAATNGTPAFASPLLRKSIERSHTLANGVTSSASHHNNGLTNGNHTDDDDKPRRMVPAFVLHSKGTYYVPITVDHQALLPYLGAHDLLATNSHDLVLHPVAINVNFQPNAHALNLQQPKKFEKI